MTASCLPSLNHAPYDSIVWALLGLLTVLAFVIYFFGNLTCHLSQFHCPQEQTYILRIISFPMLVCFIGFLSYYFYFAALYLELFSVLYEVIAIYSFYKLVIQYLGGWEEMKNMFKSMKTRKRCCSIVPVSPNFLKHVHYSVLQYTVLFPLFHVGFITIQILSYDCSRIASLRKAHMILQFLSAVTVFIAVSSLVQFVLAVSSQINQRRIEVKLFFIKFVVLLLSLQRLVITILMDTQLIGPNMFLTSENVINGVESILVVIEMTILISITHKIFPANEYVGSSKTDMSIGLKRMFDFRDFISDLRNVFIRI